VLVVSRERRYLRHRGDSLPFWARGSEWEERESSESFEDVIK
jgi:hypothetical protein